MSKIRKIKAIKKNWLENLERLFSRGINPHSKGLNLTSSEGLFLETKIKNRITIKDRINVNIKIKYNIIIIRKWIVWLP